MPLKPLLQTKWPCILNFKSQRCQNILEMKCWFNGLWLTSSRPRDGEKEKSRAEGDHGRWRKERRGGDRCAPLSWCWKAISKGGRGDFWGVSSYGDEKECSPTPLAALADWWVLSLDLSPQWFCHSFQNPKCQLEYQKGLGKRKVLK